MRTIEIHAWKGHSSRLIFSAWFLTEEQFVRWSERLLGAAGICNSLRYKRHAVHTITMIGKKGHTTEYFFDLMTPELKVACRDYWDICRRARELAEKKSWRYAWIFGGADWRRKAILRQFKKAEKIMSKEQEHNEFTTLY